MSARAYLRGRDDALIKLLPPLEMAANRRRLLSSAIHERQPKRLRKHEQTGRPLGDRVFWRGWRSGWAMF
jgi:putative transposase